MLPILLNIVALAALLPAAVVSFRAHAGRDGRFWAATLLAVLAPALWAGWLMGETWLTSLSAGLWVSIAGSAAMFALLSVTTPQAWRLGPLLMPFLALVGLLASGIGWVEAAPPRLGAAAPSAWVDLHIVLAVLTYSLLTLAAVASASIFLQERALKRKRPTALTRLLPSVADAERMSGRLLLDSEVVLGLGLVTGLVLNYVETGSLVTFENKALFSLLAFVLIGLLLIGHRVCGVRGRRAARVVLTAYLLLTLAYPGVKFVQQVLMVAAPG
ncbi:MAG: hypothetical protein RLZZ501_2616 [Pseudomonadota bacterium]|jgi:ABC-type uncharacterized transport system permease subunit